MTIPFSRPYDRKTKEGMVILRMDGNGALTVGKLGHGGVSKGFVQVGADLLGKNGVGISGEDLDFFTV